MLGACLGLVVGAAILGIIIAVMEQEEFPGWGRMIACVLAATIPAAIVNALLRPPLFFIGLGVGAVCAAFAISALCDMTLKRAALSAAIYLGIQTAISLALFWMMR